MKRLFSVPAYPVLKDLINVPSEYKTGLVKCRVIYSEGIESIAYENYTKPSIESIKLIEDNGISYDHKFLIRDRLSQWKATCKPKEDFIIVKNGLLTDGFYYNVVVEMNGMLYTPEKPLLKGVMRQYLIDRKIIVSKNLTVDDLKASKKIHLINALNPLKQLIFTTDMLT
jgi:4-amino-4-deoxychorismate lyase